MDFPGEKLVIKLWETVAEKGIGSLFRPWQMRREGRASIELKREELIAIAQAEREAEQIRHGVEGVTGFGAQVLLVDDNAASREDRQSSVAKRIQLAVDDIVIADTVRREANITRALLQAEEALESDPQVPPEAKVNDDWLYRWRESASQVSTEELQNLWGRLLAGEVKAPGTYSLRTLEFLRNLSQQEAEAVSKLSQFVIEGVIFRNATESLDSQGVNFGFLLYMQQLGIVAGVEAIGLTVSFKSLDKSKFLLTLKCNSVVLVVTADNPELTINLPVYQLTALSAQVLSLGKFEPNVGYLEKIAEHLKGQGVEITLAQYIQVSPNQIRTFNGRKL